MLKIRTFTTNLNGYAKPDEKFKSPYEELLKAGETIILFTTTLERNSRRAIAEICPKFAAKHDTIIFHHDNARPHVARMVKTFLKNIGWEFLGSFAF